MLIGEYAVKITDKNRAAMPKVFRKEMGNELVLTRGYEGCLIIVDSSRWKAIVDQVNVRPFLNTDVRNTKRFLVGGAQSINLDSQGRFVLPEMLSSYASLSSELVFVGIENWVEIWDKKAWEEKIDEIAKNAADIGDRLSNIEKLAKDNE